MIVWLLSTLLLPASAHLAERWAPNSEIFPLVDLIYNVDLSSAAAAAKRLSETYPQDPAGPFYRGLVLYQHLIMEEVRSTTTLAAFEDDMRRAEEQSQKWLAQAPARSYYYLGAAEGFHARFLVAQNRYFKAVPEGTRSIRHLRRALELDPKLEDAYLGVGMYHYFRTRIPTAAKPFAVIFFGEFGNRELGLTELQRAADKGDLAKTEALSILAAIYSSDEEAQWVKAAPILEQLMTRYPHNPLYRLRAAYVAARMGQWDRAAALAEPDGNWLDALEPEIRENTRSLALYRAAEAWALGGHPEKVEKLLDQIESRRLTEPFVDWVLLRRANIYDWQGNKLGADRLYGAIKDPDAARAAKLYLRLRYPKFLPAFKPLTGIEYPY